MNQVESGKRLQAFKKTINKRLTKEIKDNKKKTTFTPPRYDETFYEGLAWLDAME
jgi:hypothetical protein